MIPRRDKEVAAGIQRFFINLICVIIFVMVKLSSILVFVLILFSCTTMDTVPSLDGRIENENVIVEDLSSGMPSPVIREAERTFSENVTIQQEEAAIDASVQDSGDENIPSDNTATVTPRELVEQIRRMNEEEVASQETDSIEEVAKADEMPSIPIVPAEEVSEGDAMVEEPAVENVPEERDAAWLDRRLNDISYTLLMEFVLIIILFTIVSIIRGHAYEPFSLPMSLIMSLLITGAPIITAYILFGWENYYLLFLSLLLSFFVFRSRKRR